MKTIFYKGCEYKQGLNNLFYWKASLGQWKKASDQKQIANLWEEKKPKYIESDGQLLDLLKITGPLTVSHITEKLKLSVSSGKNFVGRLNALGLIEKKGFYRSRSGNGRSPVIWGLVA